MDYSNYMPTTDQFGQQFDWAYGSGRSGGFGSATSKSLGFTWLDFYQQQIANMMSMDFQREESEKAYQRSTVSAQMQQFIDAGFSPQQAKNILAGSGAAGEYTPASATIGAGTVVPPDYSQENALLSAGVQAAQTATDLAYKTGQSITDSLARPDGGYIGAAASTKTIQELMPLLASLPPSARSFYGFMSYAQSADAPQSVKDFYNGEFQSVLKNPFKAKFFQAFMKQSYDFAAGDYTLARSAILADQARADLALRQLTWDDEVASKRAEYMVTQLNAEYQSQVNPYMIQSQISALKAQFADSDLLYNLKTNPEFREQWLLGQMADVRSAAILSTVLEKKYTRQTAWLNDPQNADFVAIGELMDAAGYNSNFVADMIKASISSGVEVPQAMHRLGQVINSVVGLPDSPSSPSSPWSFRDWYFKKWLKKPSVVSDSDPTSSLVK